MGAKNPKSGTLSAKDNNALESLLALQSQAVKTRITPLLSQERIAALVNSVIKDEENNSRLPEVLTLLSAYRHEGTAAVSFETALAVAKATDKEILFIDLRTSKYQPLIELRRAVPSTLDSFLNAPNPEATPFLQMDTASLTYTCLSEQGNNTLITNKQFFQSMLNSLLTRFDMVVMNADGALENGMVPLLSNVSSDILIAIEAERTRIPVIRQLKNLIESNSGHIRGTVMTRRRKYIPAWLYRVLFGKTN